MARKLGIHKVVEDEAGFGVSRPEEPVAQTKPRKRILVAATCGALIVLAIAPLASSAPANTIDNSSAAPDQFLHEVSRHAAQGRFTCGDLTLEVVAGTEIETQDSTLHAGVLRIAINRVYRHVRLSGSDGNTYRVSAVVSAWFVLKAPDFDNPVRGDEYITVVFRSAADSSPGYLREHISIRNGKEKEVVSGPCDFADE